MWWWCGVVFLTLMIPTLGCIGLPKIKSSPVWWCGGGVVVVRWWWCGGLVFFTHNNTTLRLHWVTLGCGNLYITWLVTANYNWVSSSEMQRYSTSWMFQDVLCQCLYEPTCPTLIKKLHYLNPFYPSYMESLYYNESVLAGRLTISLCMLYLVKTIVLYCVTIL